MKTVAEPTLTSQPAKPFAQRLRKESDGLKCPKCFRRVEMLPHVCKVWRAR